MQTISYKKLSIFLSSSSQDFLIYFLFLFLLAQIYLSTHDNKLKNGLKYFRTAKEHKFTGEREFGEELEVEFDGTGLGLIK